VEAGRLQAKQEEFIAETGLDFRFLFALYEGASGNPANANDCDSYAETIGALDFPVFADNSKQISSTTPITQKTHPQMCGMTPEMVILDCYGGHNAYENALNDIKAHAGL
jgi:hypothetical protein